MLYHSALRHVDKCLAYVRWFPEKMKINSAWPFLCIHQFTSSVTVKLPYCTVAAHFLVALFTNLLLFGVGVGSHRKWTMVFGDKSLFCCRKIGFFLSSSSHLSFSKSQSWNSMPMNGFSAIVPHTRSKYSIFDTI